MVVKVNGRLQFRDGYERMAYMTMEVATGNQTQVQLAERLKLSPQRVSQILKAGYARAGCKPGTDPAIVGFKLRLADQAREGCVRNTPEFFFKYERFNTCGCCAPF